MTNLRAIALGAACFVTCGVAAAQPTQNQNNQVQGATPQSGEVVLTPTVPVFSPLASWQPLIPTPTWGGAPPSLPPVLGSDPVSGPLDVQPSTALSLVEQGNSLPSRIITSSSTTVTRLITGYLPTPAQAPGLVELNPAPIVETAVPVRTVPSGAVVRR